METILETNRQFHLKKVEDSLRLAKIYLNLSCGWPENNGLLFKCISYFNIGSCWVICLWQHIFLYKNWGNLQWSVAVYTTMVMVIQVAIKHIVIHYNRTLYRKLLNTVRYEFWPLNSFKQSYAQIQYTMIWINRLLLVYGISGIFITLCWAIFPYVGALPGFRKLPIVSWYPFDVNKSPTHEITWFWIGYVGGFIMFGIPGFDMLFSVLIMHLCVQYKLLRIALSSINNKIYKDGHDNNSIYKEMIFCLEYHSKLNGFCNDVRKLFKICFTTDLFLSGGAICVLFYLIQEERNNLTNQVKLIGYFFVILLQLSLYCVFGTNLQQASLDIRNAAYESGWYNAHPQFRRGLVYIIQNASKEQQLRGLPGSIDLNNRTLITIFRMAFSFSTLLKKLKG